MKTHTVKKGETLWSIAEKYYGSGRRWREIYRDNRRKIARRGNLIFVGTRLTIPNAERRQESSTLACFARTEIRQQPLMCVGHDEISIQTAPRFSQSPSPSSPRDASMPALEVELPPLAVSEEQVIMRGETRTPLAKISVELKAKHSSTIKKIGIISDDPCTFNIRNYQIECENKLSSEVYDNVSLAIKPIDNFNNLEVGLTFANEDWSFSGGFTTSPMREIIYEGETPIKKVSSQSIEMNIGFTLEIKIQKNDSPTALPDTVSVPVAIPQASSQVQSTTDWEGILIGVGIFAGIALT
ncbi:MAG: LysM peptidoglycan-binding domain-containing protein, partial [Saprospiraceae bacterium]